MNGYVGNCTFLMGKQNLREIYNIGSPYVGCRPRYYIFIR